MTLLHVRIVLLAIIPIATASMACCEEAKLHALVIGNSNYPIGTLKNPANDARLMAQSLTDLGFQVTAKTDLSHQEMEDAVSEFGRMVPKGGLAFFFFAGHGLQVRGENYLIPTDAKIKDEAAVKRQRVKKESA